MSVVTIRSKVTEKQALRYTEEASTDEITDFVGGEWVTTDPPENGRHSLVEGRLRLWNTEERQHITIPPGHWIIKGVSGEVYPCSDEVLHQSYEIIE